MHFVGQSIVSQSLKTTHLMDGPSENYTNHLYIKQLTNSIAPTGVR